MIKKNTASVLVLISAYVILCSFAVVFALSSYYGISGLSFFAPFSEDIMIPPALDWVFQPPHHARLDSGHR